MIPSFYNTPRSRPHHSFPETLTDPRRNGTDESSSAVSIVDTVVLIEDAYLAIKYAPGQHLARNALPVVSAALMAADNLLKQAKRSRCVVDMLVDGQRRSFDIAKEARSVAKQAKRLVIRLQHQDVLIGEQDFEALIVSAIALREAIQNFLDMEKRTPTLPYPTNSPPIVHRQRAEYQNFREKHSFSLAKGLERLISCCVKERRVVDERSPTAMPTPRATSQPDQNNATAPMYWSTKSTQTDPLPAQEISPSSAVLETKSVVLAPTLDTATISIPAVIVPSTNAPQDSPSHASPAQKNEQSSTVCSLGEETTSTRNSSELTQNALVARQDISLPTEDADILSATPSPEIKIVAMSQETESAPSTDVQAAPLQLSNREKSSQLPDVCERGKEIPEAKEKLTIDALDLGGSSLPGIKQGIAQFLSQRDVLSLHLTSKAMERFAAPQVKHIRAYNSEHFESMLKKFSMGNPESIYFTPRPDSVGGDFTEQDMEKLPKTLKKLSMGFLDDIRSESVITDASMEQLKDMPLEYLDVSGSKVTDAGLAHLKPENMRHLGLTCTSITDRALPYFQAMPKLQYLNVKSCLISRSTQDALLQMQRKKNKDLTPEEAKSKGFKLNIQYPRLI